MNAKIKSVEAKLNVLLKERAKAEKEHDKIVSTQEKYLTQAIAAREKAFEKIDSKTKVLEDKIERLTQTEEAKHD